MVSHSPESQSLAFVLISFGLGDNSVICSYLSSFEDNISSVYQPVGVTPHPHIICCAGSVCALICILVKCSNVDYIFTTAVPLLNKCSTEGIATAGSGVIAPLRCLVHTVDR